MCLIFSKNHNFRLYISAPTIRQIHLETVSAVLASKVSSKYIFQYIYIHIISHKDSKFDKRKKKKEKLMFIKFSNIIFQQMKYSLIFLAILGVATAASVSGNGKAATKSLEDDLNDFVALFDGAALLEVVLPYLAEDEEVQEVLYYLSSEEFKSLVLAVEAVPEYIAFLDYTQAAGLDVYKWVDLIHTVIGLEPLTRSTSVRNGKGIAGLIDDVLALVPREELKALYLEKLETSPEFAEFAAQVNSDEFQVIVNAVKENPEFQNLRAALASKGVDVDAIVKVFKDLIELA